MLLTLCFMKSNTYRSAIPTSETVLTIRSLVLIYIIAISTKPVTLE